MASTLGYAWARILRGYANVHLSLHEWLPVQGAAWAGRYLPGKIGLLAGKMTLLSTKALTLRQLMFSVLFEQIAFVVVGAAVVLAVYPLDRSELELLGAGSLKHLHAFWRVIAAAGLCLGLFAGFNLIASRMSVVRKPSFVESAVILVLYFFSHALAGLGFFFILNSMPDAAAPEVLHVIALLAAANVVGTLAIFAPAGLGVREAVLAAGLSPYIRWTDALALAAILRVLSLVADMFFILATGGVALLYKYRAGRHSD